MKKLFFIPALLFLVCTFVLSNFQSANSSVNHDKTALKIRVFDEKGEEVNLLKTEGKKTGTLVRLKLYTPEGKPNEVEMCACFGSSSSYCGTHTIYGPDLSPGTYTFCAEGGGYVGGATHTISGSTYNFDIIVTYNPSTHCSDCTED